MPIATRALVCGTWLVTCVACASSPGEAPPDASDEGVVSCLHDPRVRAYAPGMVTLGSQGALSFRLVASDPAPPGKGNNVLAFDVLPSEAGAGARLTLKVNLRMPDHGHTTSVLPMVHDDGQRYMIDPVYMFMPGVWRLDLTAFSADSDAGGPLDAATLFFCVEG